MTSVNCSTLNGTCEDFLNLHPCDNYTSYIQESDFDEDLFLTLCLGEKRHHFEYLIPLTIVDILLFITGMFGNFLVCYVIIQNRTMRTSTNFFLFSLAISDLSLLFVGLPNDLHVYWQQYPWLFGDPLCRIRAVVSEMTSYSSVLTIVAFSMERYIAICHPLYSVKMSGLRRSSKIIASLWIVSAAAAMPYGIYTKVHYITHPFTNEIIEASAFCTIQPSPPYLFEFSSLSFFFIPLTIMIFLYSSMGLRIRETSLLASSASVNGDSVQIKSRKAVIKMLAAVVIAFFVCWAPFHAQRLLYVIFYDYEWKFVTEEFYQMLNEKLFYITGCLYYFSTTVNPILYNLISVKYRKAFKESLCWSYNKESFDDFGPETSYSLRSKRTQFRSFVSNRPNLSLEKSSSKNKNYESLLFPFSQRRNNKIQGQIKRGENESKDNSVVVIFNKETCEFSIYGSNEQDEDIL